MSSNNNNNNTLREESEVTSISNNSASNLKALKHMSLSSDPKKSSPSSSPLQPPVSSSVKLSTTIDSNGLKAAPAPGAASHATSEEAKGGPGSGLFADVADRAKFDDPELLQHVGENQEDSQDARVSVFSGRCELKILCCLCELIVNIYVCMVHIHFTLIVD
jgi:hypothetical protein